MPDGCFVILLPTESEYKVLGYYFGDKRINFEITSNLFLRLNLDHSKNEFSLLKLKDVSIASYIRKFTGKLGRKANGIIVGLLLSEGDEGEKYSTNLKNTADAIQALNLLEMSKENFEAKLKDIYQENLESLTEVLDPEDIKRRIINHAKEMIGGGKKERKLADELLKKIEANEHSKIIEFYKMAEEAGEIEDYKVAASHYNKAADKAEELYEEELAKTLRDKANVALKIPTGDKKITELAQTARKYLRNEHFTAAYRFYRLAADEAKKLMKPEEEEEYRLKAKALQAFAEVDDKFKKK